MPVLANLQREGPRGIIPQGGGEHYSGHRCAGEWLTITLMKRAVRLLTESTHYDVPGRELRIRLQRMPAIPESGFVMSNVRSSSAR